MALPRGALLSDRTILQHVLLLATLSGVMVFAAPGRAGAQVTVQQVTVELTFDDVAPAPMIRDRLEATVVSVADRLLLGRTLDQVASLQPEETIASVVGHVTVGYEVTTVTVYLGPLTTVAVHMRAAGPVVRVVTVALELPTVHPRVRGLVDALLRPGPAAELQVLLAGLPVASLEWAGPLIELRVRDVVEAALPGFTGRARIRPGETAELVVMITPRDSRVIRNIGVRFRSNSIPLMLLEPHGPQVASMAEPLRGLPVAFADATRTSLEELLDQELAAYSPTAQYQVVATARLEVAETTYVTVTAESLVWRARVEARLNIGTSAPGPEVVGHVGQLVAPPIEPFVEIRLVPTPLALTADVGLRYEVSPTTSVGATYAPSLLQTDLWATVQLSRDVGLRAEWLVPDRVFEGTAIYRINEFLTWELIGTSHGDVWLRLVSNL